MKCSSLSLSILQPLQRCRSCFLCLLVSLHPRNPLVGQRVERILGELEVSPGLCYWILPSAWWRCWNSWRNMIHLLISFPCLPSFRRSLWRNLSFLAWDLCSLLAAINVGSILSILSPLTMPLLICRWGHGLSCTFCTLPACCLGWLICFFFGTLCRHLPPILVWNFAPKTRIPITFPPFWPATMY